MFLERRHVVLMEAGGIAGRLSEEVKLPFEDHWNPSKKYFLHNSLGHVFKNEDTVVKN